MNRIIRATDKGYEYEADPRHGEFVIKKLRLVGTKGVVSLGTDEELTDDRIDLQGEEATEYRSLAARLNYLSADKPDLQYAVKEICRTMSSPTSLLMQRLIRVAKYLVQRPRLVWKFHWQGQNEQLQVWCDANWAGCRTTKKSTSGGVIQIGEHTLRTYSKTHSNIALSSAESKLYAMVKAVSE